MELCKYTVYRLGYKYFRSVGPLSRISDVLLRRTILLEIAQRNSLTLKTRILAIGMVQVPQRCTCQDISKI